MNVSEQLDKNHLLVLQSVDNLPDLEWDIPNVCGMWSTKDIIAHITSYEHVMADVFRSFLEESPDTSYLSRFIKQRDDFRKTEVEARRYFTAQQVIDEYEDAQAETSSLLTRIPAEVVDKVGTMPWYGQEYRLSDLIQRMSVHIQEHCDQIAAFRQREKE